MPITKQQAEQAVLDLLADITPDEVLGKATAHVLDMLQVCADYLSEPQDIDKFAWDEQEAFLALYGINTANDFVHFLSKCKHPAPFGSVHNQYCMRAALRLKTQL